MKILHCGTLDINNGGPAMSTYLTLYGLREQNVDAEIIMYPLSSKGKLIGNKVPIYYASKPIDNKLLFSLKLKKEIIALNEYDIYHAQGIWTYLTYATIDCANRNHKPYIITPRGMLYPQDIAKSNSFLKKLSLKVRLLKDLNNAACVHVTCIDEMKHCRDLGITSPIAVIPNPIILKEYNKKSLDKFRVGYLGRLSPRKNVESLIYAFKTLQKETEDKELIIIGNGDDNYETFLKNEVRRLNLKNIIFTGFLSGEEKDKILDSLSILAMPSEFENLGNVILEGLIRGIPCIATKGAPWEQLNTYNCGWWVDFTQESITAAIKEAINCSHDELIKLGENGKNLVREHYSHTQIATKIKSLYKWILNSGEKPDFVYD